MRKLKGIVVSNKMQKTVVVRIDSLKKHPKYEKYYRTSRKFKAHAAEGAYSIGDVVAIRETRPLSKEKRWEVVELLKKGAQVVAGDEDKEGTEAV